MGTTTFSIWGAMSFSPSTADSTEMAGVITASPYKKAAPAIPRTRSTRALRLATDWPSAIRAKVPPSPLLSALSSTRTYLRVTMSSIVHVMRDSMPTMAAKVPAPCA